jgi:hypothetical protein
MTGIEIQYKKHKKRLLYLCLLIDTMGMLSYFIPGIGEWTDILMSVLTAFAIFRSFGSYGWAAFGFLEEILPFTDVIPSATIVWVYSFLINGKETRARFLSKQKETE